MRIYVEYTQWPIKLLFTLMINFVKHINAELDKQVYFWVHDQQQLLRVDFLLVESHDLKLNTPLQYFALSTFQNKY